MMSFEFRIEEVNRDGCIAWDAVEAISGDRFPVNATERYSPGKFPEITNYLRARGIDFDVNYSEQHNDSLRDLAWRYVRGGSEVVVRDIPRTIFRIGAFG